MGGGCPQGPRRHTWLGLRKCQPLFVGVAGSPEGQRLAECRFTGEGQRPLNRRSGWAQESGAWGLLGLMVFALFSVWQEEAEIPALQPPT